MTDSARFVGDLQDPFASLLDAGVDAGGPAVGRVPLSLAFLTDLPAIYSEAALELPGIYDPPEEHLYALATAFTRWRKAELARRSLSQLFRAEVLG